MAFQKTNQSVSITFDKCVVVRHNSTDTVYLHIAKKDIFGRDIKAVQSLHNGFDEFNTRDLTIKTVLGNGPNLARNLGWMLRIEIIDATKNAEHILSYIESWEKSDKINIGSPELFDKTLRTLNEITDYCDENQNDAIVELLDELGYK